MEGRENLRLICEGWEAEAEAEPVPLTDYVSKLSKRIKYAHELATVNLEAAQGKMKAQYDKKSKVREFKGGDLVLLFDNTACRHVREEKGGETKTDVERRHRRKQKKGEERKLL